MIKDYLKNPTEFAKGLMIFTAGLWPDKLYLKIYHKLMTGKCLDIDHPKTYSEKCQWLKLYYQKPELATMVDKYEVKKYVADKIGGEYVVECYGVWDSFDQIDFEKLPNQFVLKTTHNSGGYVICNDKNTFDFNVARKKIEYSLSHSHYKFAREWAYKNVKPRIIAEKYMDSLGKPESIEYKITCMGGVVRTVTVCSGIAHAAYEERHNDNFSREWERQNWYARYTPTGKDFKKTPEIEKMIELSEKLTQGFPLVRADWYVHEGIIFFGELTFYTWAGWPLFTPDEWDEKMGAWIELPPNKIIEK